MNADQKKEVEKYIHIYGTHPHYHMSGKRGGQAQDDLALTDERGTYLDVGCGRGEMLDYAADILMFTDVKGTETVPALYDKEHRQFALVTELPFEDDGFDVVCCLDVLEHLLPDDTEQALTELARVAKHSLLLTANNKTSNSLGVELHINRRPYDEWDQLIKLHCGGSVEWLDRKDAVSETWLVSFD